MENGSPDFENSIAVVFDVGFRYSISVFDSHRVFDFCLNNAFRNANSWLAADITERPIVNLVSAQFSPIALCIDEYCALLSLLPRDVFPLLVGLSP